MLLPKHPYSKTHKCSICGLNYVLLSGYLQISNSYRLGFCKDCTTLMETAARKFNQIYRKTKA